MILAHDPQLVAIVDDEAALREATESLLRSAGYAAESFESAEAFLHSPCRHRAGCLILDVRLPGMSGLELHRHLACSGSPIPTVLITAQEDRNGQMQAQALRAGALAFLPKPFSDDEVFAAIELAFGDHGAR